MPQMQYADCGAACLAAVAQAYGSPVSLRDARLICNVGRDGVSARMLLDAARQLGFEGSAVRAGIEAFPELPAPFVAHMRDLHYVVVSRVRGDTAYVMDPALGRRRVALTELAAEYSGVAITFSAPGPPARLPRGANPRRVRALISVYVSLLRSLRWPVLVTIMATGALQTAALLTPFVVTQVSAQDAVPLSLLALIVTGCGLAYVGASVARGLLLLRIKLRHDDVVASTLLSRLVGLPLEYFHARSSADLLSRVASTASMRDTITAAAVTGIVDAVAALIAIVAFGLVNLLVQGAAIALAVVVFVVPLACYRASRPHALAQLEKRSTASGRLVMLLLGIEQAKAHGAEGAFVESWRDVYREELAATRRLGRVEVVLQTTVDATRAVAAPLLIIVALVSMRDASSAIALGLAAVGFLGPVIGLSRSLVGILSLQAHVHRIEDVLAEPQPVQRGLPVGTRPAGIEVRDASYTYPGARTPALRDVDLSVSAGSTVMFAGVSGSGKSTLARLIAGLMDVDAGSVRIIDGDTQVAPTIGYVTQTVALYPGTLESNILFGRTASDEDVARAVELADLTEFVQTLDRGLKTIVVDGGHAFSGGQRQRIAIARALLARPAVVVLDEATSNIGPESEMRILTRLQAVDATKIVITHRPHVIERAEHVVYLEEGRVVGVGDHGTLADTCPEYATFWNAARAGTGAAVAAARPRRATKRAATKRAPVERAR